MNYSNSDLQALSDEALVHAELQLDRDLVTLHFKKNAGQLRNVTLIKNARRNIARVRSEQRRREIEGNLIKDSLRDIHRATFSAKATVVAGGSSFAADLNEQMEDDQ